MEEPGCVMHPGSYIKPTRPVIANAAVSVSEKFGS